MARPRKDGTPAKRPQRGPIPSNDPPPGYLDPDVPVLTDRVDEAEIDQVGESFAMHIEAPRKHFMQFFAGGSMPVVDGRYVFVCVQYEDGGIDDVDVHSASFRLVRAHV